MSSGRLIPWSDEITLIWREKEQDASGFESVKEHRSTPPLMCSGEAGVSQSEFYRSMKAGSEASAQAEVQTVDFEEFWPTWYTGPYLAEFRGKRYRILRTFPQSYDTTTLILTEVIR